MNKELKALEKRRKAKNISPNSYRAVMEDPENAVEFDGLQTSYFTEKGILRAVDGVCFTIPKGKTVAVLGESGCGKTAVSLSLMQLLPRPQGQITGGSIRLNLGDRAVDLTKMPEKALRQLRGREMAMIFQEPMTSLNPVLTVGRQLDEAHTGGKARSVSLLQQVGIPNPEGVYQMYPHALSGGMRQRVMIAMALANRPRVIVADEPTTALDVTIQAQILELLKQLKEELHSAVLLITHDLGVVAGLADLVVVMYAGKVVERGTVEEIFKHPAHPYTLGLMVSKPVVGKKQEKLFTIGGQVPDPLHLPEHCYFRERCHRGENCDGAYPDMVRLSPTHFVSCREVTSE